LDRRFIPDEGIMKTGIIKHLGAQDQAIGKPDHPATQPVIGKIGAAKFKQCSIQVTDLCYIAFKSTQFYPVTHPVRSPENNVKPGNKRSDGRLQSKAKYQRYQPKGNRCCSPVFKQKRNNDHESKYARHKPGDPYEVVAISA